MGSLYLSVVDLSTHIVGGLQTELQEVYYLLDGDFTSVSNTGVTFYSLLSGLD